MILIKTINFSQRNPSNLKGSWTNSLKLSDKETTIIYACNNKAKTRKSAAKRYKVTSGGKILRRCCGKQHLNEKKSTCRKNKLSKYHNVARSDVSNVSKCLQFV